MIKITMNEHNNLCLTFTSKNIHRAHFQLPNHITNFISITPKKEQVTENIF